MRELARAIGWALLAMIVGAGFIAAVLYASDFEQALH